MQTFRLFNFHKVEPGVGDASVGISTIVFFVRLHLHMNVFECGASRLALAMNS